jgi:hypothetical protein
MIRPSKLQGLYLITLMTTGHQTLGSWNHSYMINKIRGCAEPNPEIIPNFTMTIQEASTYYFFKQRFSYMHI